MLRKYPFSQPQLRLAPALADDDIKHYARALDVTDVPTCVARVPLACHGAEGAIGEDNGDAAGFYALRLVKIGIAHAFAFLPGFGRSPFWLRQ